MIPFHEDQRTVVRRDRSAKMPELQCPTRPRGLYMVGQESKNPRRGSNQSCDDGRCVDLCKDSNVFYMARAGCQGQRRCRGAFFSSSV